MVHQIEQDSQRMQLISALYKRHRFSINTNLYRFLPEDQKAVEGYNQPSHYQLKFTRYSNCFRHYE